MIAPNYEDFTVEDTLKAFYCLLLAAGGKMAVKKVFLENNVPKDFKEKIKVESISDENGCPDAYVISIPVKPKKRGVIKLSDKKLILPN